MISSSPERHTFQLEQAKERAKEDGKEVPEFYKNFWKSAKEKDEANSVDPEWQKDNMEYDLRSTQWIVDKAKGDNVYAQNLYAAMCNNDFTKNDVWPILTEKRWSCSWRHAGGIVADMQESGDYIDWYCSGIRNENDLTTEEFNDLTLEQQSRVKETGAYVSESVVTDEIRADLLKLGWIVIDDPNDNF